MLRSIWAWLTKCLLASLQCCAIKTLQMRKDTLQLIYRPTDLFEERKRTACLYSEAQTTLTTAPHSFLTNSCFQNIHTWTELDQDPKHSRSWIFNLPMSVGLLKNYFSFFLTYQHRIPNSVLKENFHYKIQLKTNWPRYREERTVSATTVCCVCSLQTSECSDMLSCQLHLVTQSAPAQFHRPTGLMGLSRDMLQVLLPRRHEHKVYWHQFRQ